MEAYIKHRIRTLRGNTSIPEDIDEITRYTQRRMRELKQSSEFEKELDKSLLGCYTVGTMGVDGG